jgi:hypothetical protein
MGFEQQAERLVFCVHSRALTPVFNSVPAAQRVEQLLPEAAAGVCLFDPGGSFSMER